MKNPVLIFFFFLLTFPLALIAQPEGDGKCMAGDCDSGSGILQLSNGDVYEGEFKNGQQHGKGKYTYINGAEYKGMWAKGKQHGKGTYTTSKGEEKHGEWQDGKRVRWLDKAEFES